MDNPIKDNRIVNDITFATRLRSFLDGVEVCDGRRRVRVSEGSSRQAGSLPVCYLPGRGEMVF